MKGCSFLLEAFRKLLDISPGISLLMVGGLHDQREEELWEHRVHGLGLRGHVFVTGRVPHSHVGAWLNEMDIFAFPSLYEGSPNALLEAMAHGLPVVASGVSGVLDLITDGEEGLLIPPGCADALAQKLKALVQNEALRSRLGESARRAVENRFMPQHEARMWLSAYQSVVDGHQPGT